MNNTPIISFIRHLCKYLFACNVSAAVFIALIYSSFLAGCGDKLPVEKELKDYRFTLLNEDSTRVIFPEYLRGKIVVMGFIFTNCPDICPMTTHNMQAIKEEAEKQGMKGIAFTSLTFDPSRDRPSVLKKFAGVRDIDLREWDFLTGNHQVIDSMKKAMNFVAAAGDTSFTDDGMPYYFFVHTDRITLIDGEGRIRKNYKGSKIDIKEIINDIKTIWD